MAIKKTLTEAIPSSTGGKVVSWRLTMKYEQGTEGEDDYYTNDKPVTVNATETNVKGETTTNFTPKAEGSWSKSELEGLCPTAKWDEILKLKSLPNLDKSSTDPVPNSEFAIPS